MAQYYVHYSEFNRRLDEWVGAERLSVMRTEATRSVGGAERKRKLDPAVASSFPEPMMSRADEAAAGELDAATQREHEAATRVKNINKIILGKWEIQTWYFSPFPKEYSSCDTLYFCEYDLHFTKKPEALQRYLRRSQLVHPPGDEIYRHGNISVFEVDGARARSFCQNLCLLAKLFLDHKTLYYDVDPFLFYVMTEWDEQGCHPVAYFSKEKYSAEEYNLACILTLPPCAWLTRTRSSPPRHASRVSVAGAASVRRSAEGDMAASLIAFSYELSRKEAKVGTPERPLSDLGMVSYRSYWASVLLAILQSHRGAISIKQLSEMSAIKTDDIISTLQALNLIKYWKGQHMISVSPRVLQEHLINESAKTTLQVDSSCFASAWMPHAERVAAAQAALNWAAESAR